LPYSNKLLPQDVYRTAPSSTPKPQAGKLGCLGIFGLLLLTIVLTVAGTVWAIQSQLFARNFKPVELSTNEQQTLEQKLNALGDSENTLSSSFNTATPTDGDENNEASGAEDIVSSIGSDNSNENSEKAEQPEVYTEDDSKRRIELTERELNALLAENTDLAEQLVVDLTDNLASIKLLVDVDPDFPFFGGKTLKVSGGTELSYQNDKPVVIMKGVSVWGVPIPNAWLGGLKNIDLVQEFGGNDGFWKSLAEGIEDIRVQDGKLLIQLAE